MGLSIEEVIDDLRAKFSHEPPDLDWSDNPELLLGETTDRHYDRIRNDNVELVDTLIGFCPHGEKAGVYLATVLRVVVNGGGTGGLMVDRALSAAAEKAARRELGL